MALLKDGRVRSYVVGTSNVLYREQKHLSDVLVDVSCRNGRVLARISLQKGENLAERIINARNWPSLVENRSVEDELRRAEDN